jgi:peptide chain release factor 1
MLEKLKTIADKVEALQEQLYDTSITADHKKMIAIQREISSLSEPYELYLFLKKRTDQKYEAKEMIENETDAEMIDMAKSELQEAEQQLEGIDEKIKIALLPKDPNDERNVFLEVRQAAWGDEAGLFAAELLRMYLRYAERQWLKAEIIEHDRTWIWGLKFAMVKIAGEKVYSKLKFESWVHRVQRIPDTETNGRVHTSTVTVAVMPEVDDVEIHIDPNDVEMDTFAASSSGGQNANKNQTWVRLRHIPTGIIVMGQDGKSQMQNKENARKMLRTKLYQTELDRQIKEQKEKRFDQVGSGDRSEKIRTYNFPQDRVTDHRIKQSRSNIPGILDGEIEDIMSQIIVENQTKLLENAGE